MIQQIWLSEGCRHPVLFFQIYGKMGLLACIYQNNIIKGMQSSCQKNPKYQNYLLKTNTTYCFMRVPV
uniref:Uncharacterized protein n=1 Tax=Lepeophtheirus salmonis TaxID=72036 RepID=A0A0K2TZP0_LEPSM